MFDLGFPPYWSTLKKLIWLVGSGVVGGTGWTTLTGAIVSFFAKKSAPINALSVTLEPQQDLHGQDAPYPGGGGKNKFPFNGITETINGVTFTAHDDGTITVNGTASDAIVCSINYRDASSPTGTYCHLSEIGIKPDTSYILNGCPSNGSTATYWLQLLVYGSGAEPLDIGNGSSAFSFSESDVADKWYRLGIRIANGFTANNLVFKPMIRLSSEADATFAPYSNLCPITGWTGAKVTRTGKNLFDESCFTSNGCAIENGFYTGNFTQIKNGLNSAISKIKFKENTQYTISCDFYSTANVYFRFYFNYTDGTTAQISPSTSTTEQHLTKTTVSGKTLSSITASYSSSGTIYIKNLIVEESTSETTYEPFGTTYEIEFPDGAGTVYGGTLDVISGKLRVTQVLVDLGTLTWNRGVDNGNYYFYTTGLLSLIATGKSYSALICSRYKTASIGIPQNNCVSQNKTNNISTGAVLIADSAYTDKDAFKTAMSGVQLVYELATFVEYTLTPQQINTLAGQNNVFGDGTVSVTIPSNIIVEGT